MCSTLKAIFCSKRETNTLPISKPFNFNHEKDRLNSFNEWPIEFISEIVLANTGFYYLGRDDHVQCQFCNIILYNWSKGDDEVREHIKWSPHCPLIRRYHTQNVPLEPTIDYLLPPVASSIDECDCSKHLKDRKNTKYQSISTSTTDEEE